MVGETVYCQMTKCGYTYRTRPNSLTSDKALNVDCLPSAACKSDLRNYHGEGRVDIVACGTVKKSIFFRSLLRDILLPQDTRNTSV